MKLKTKIEVTVSLLALSIIIAVMCFLTLERRKALLGTEAPQGQQQDVHGSAAEVSIDVSTDTVVETKTPEPAAVPVVQTLTNTVFQLDFDDFKLVDVQSNK